MGHCPLCAVVLCTACCPAWRWGGKYLACPLLACTSAPLLWILPLEGSRHHNFTTLLTFPTCEISRSLRGMSWSLLELPWDLQTCCRVIQGPPKPAGLCPQHCKQQLIALTGAGGSVWEAPRHGKRGPPQLHQLHSEELHPKQGGTNQHQSAQQHQSPSNFPLSSSWWAQDPLHLQEHHPMRSSPFPCSLPQEHHPTSQG